MKSNITKLCVANVLTGLVFWYPVEKLFMKTIGITPFGVGINAVVLLSITILLDVPAGVLADRWKRSYTLVLALTALAGSSLLLGLSHSLPIYLLGTCLYGIYLVCTSGTFQALMYDSLLDEGKQNEYDKYQGRSYALFLAGVSISSLLGGYIAAGIGYRATYYFSVVPALLTILVLLSIKEPKKHKVLQGSHYLQHIAKGFAALKVNPIVFHLAFFSVMAGILRSTQNEFAGLYYIALGLTAIPTGYVNAAKWLTGSLGQVYARRIGRKSLKLVPVMFVSFFLFTLFHSVVGIIFFLIAVLLHSIMQNQAEAEIQNHISSDIRATTISSISFMTNVILVPLGLAFGW
ncbi:MAG TPA: MFS transporter, partial [Methylococcales bacterium]